MIVTSVLGDVREVEPNESGEYGCPFCGAYVKAPEPCGNPVCDAGRWTTREAAEARQVERERRAAERAEWERRAEAQRAASEAYAEARRARLDEWHVFPELVDICQHGPRVRARRPAHLRGQGGHELGGQGAARIARARGG